MAGKKSARASAAAGAAVLMLASAAAAQAAATVSTGWRVVATAGGKSSLGYMEAVAAPAPGDAWAFGELISRTVPDSYTAVVRHWDGRSWRKAVLPPDVTTALSGFPSTIAAGSSPSNVWAFTGSGAWIRYNGRSWSTGELPIEKPADDGHITSAVVLGPHDVWALGYYNPVSPLPYIAHYNGHHWKLTNLYLNTAIVGASALSATDIWAVGNSNTNVLLHFNGHSWKQVRLPARANFAFFAGVVALSDKEVWVTGDINAGPGGFSPGVMRWNGRSMQFLALKAPAPLFNTTPDGHGGIWAVAQEPGAVAAFRPELWHYSRGQWHSGHIHGGDAADFIDSFAAVPGRSSMWAVGLFKSGRLDVASILVEGPLPH